ncbi:MAG: metabolite traffic protein EboE [Tatlockia sp.]|jgi:hypothetical protein
MKIGQSQDFDLAYCSNVYRGEDWTTVFNNLKHFLPELKDSLAPHNPFGVGLRLSSHAVDSLVDPGVLKVFKEWLFENEFYVTTINAFPYGDFHGTSVKDRVYMPDWTTLRRRDYSLKIMQVLAELTPPGEECGFSTVPLSYKYWLSKGQMQATYQQCVLHISELAVAMSTIYDATQTLIHMDIEPEPDCLIETMDELIAFFDQWLIPEGSVYVAQRKKISLEQAEYLLRRHIQVCYDICHSSVEFEKPTETFNKLVKADIGIGKIQVSSALRCEFNSNTAEVLENLNEFVDSTYLHQVIEHHADNTLTHKGDLAHQDSIASDIDEVRVHFHVPIFLDRYGLLNSTQNDIIEMLHLLQQNKLTKHLEIETYTWEVLPPSMRLDLRSSIEREYRWVINHF